MIKLIFHYCKLGNLYIKSFYSSSILNIQLFLMKNFKDIFEIILKDILLNKRNFDIIFFFATKINIIKLLIKLLNLIWLNQNFVTIK